MAKKVTDKKQLKREAGVAESQGGEAEKIENARLAEMSAKLEADLAIKLKKREAEEARRVEKAARQQAKREARLAKKAKRGPRIFDRKFISLYITDASIKLLMMKGKHVIQWGELLLEPGLVSSGVITDPAVMAGKIRELMASRDVKGKKVIAGMSGLHCLSRVLTLPALSQSLLGEAVRREAARELPVPLENLYLSWQIIRRSRDEIKVFIIAYTRNVADALMQTLRRANLKPYLMDLAPLAITRVVNKKTAVVADVRLNELDIVVMVDGIPELVRSVPLRRSLIDEFPLIKEELERTINFYNSNELERPLGDNLPVFVSGELVDEPALYQSLSGELGYSVLSPLPPLRYAEGLSPAQYMVNIGLVLKELYVGGAGLSRVNLNALPDVYRRKHPSKAKLVGIPAGVLGVAALMGMALLVRGAGAYTDSLRNNLEAANQVVSQRSVQQQTLNNAIADLDKRLTQSAQTQMTFSAARDNLESQQSNVNLDLPLVTGNLSEGMTLTAVKYLGSVITVSGKASNQARILSYAESLRASGRYSEVVVASISKTGAVMDFALTLNR